MPQPGSISAAVRISVLICSHNRAESLRRTLSSLLSPRNLEASDWETILVIDRDCDAATREVAADCARRYPHRFRYLIQEKKGKSNALNLAIGTAKGDVLAMTDDDVVCGAGYLDGIRTVFADGSIDGAQGRILLDCEGGRPPWVDGYFARFLSLRDYGSELRAWDDNLAGTNMVVRKDAAQRIGGYRPDLGAGAVGFAEDSEFSSRLREVGCRLVYAPEILVHHRLPRERLTRSFFRERFFRTGRSLAYLRPLPTPLWRFAAFTARELMRNELASAWQRLRGRAAAALRRQCDAREHLGFLWQHWLLHRASAGASPVPGLAMGEMERFTPR